MTSRTRRTGQRGQTLVEFALCLSAFGLLIFGALQLALIGNAALAVSQLAYAGARYAAVNPTYSQASIVSYMKSIAPATIAENNGGDLTIAVSPDTAPRSFGTSVSVSVSYNLASKLFLPSPFLGLALPTTLGSIQDTMMSE